MLRVPRVRPNDALVRRISPSRCVPQQSEVSAINQSFLTRLSADGSGLIHSTFTDTLGNQARGVAVDPADDASVALISAVAQGFAVMRFNFQGTDVTFSRSLPATSLTGLADGAGYTYVTASTSKWGLSGQEQPDAMRIHRIRGGERVRRQRRCSAVDLPRLGIEQFRGFAGPGCLTEYNEAAFRRLKGRASRRYGEWRAR